MAILHTVNKSPFERNSLETCLTHAKAGSSVLLFEDGVYAAMQGTAVSEKVKAAMQDLKVYALGPDMKARSLDEGRIIGGIDVVDYTGFVDLAAASDKVQAWL
ncbi:MAG: sulfurtransferase complex subunit TusB [Gammaproteobacteria bacterium]|nr:sulfurtransferase complex subunit TusB [Gammaproteobacteria bacterium]